MSILIEGISSLKEGLYQVQDGKIHAYKGNGGKVQEFDLVEVPTPHGRLIDGDNLIELCGIMADKCDGIGVSIWEQFAETVRWCPTIIEAEEGEEA